MLTEMELALSAKVSTLEAQSKAMKEAALASINAANTLADIERKYAEELTEAVGGIEVTKQIIAQHRMRKVHQRRQQLIDELRNIDLMIAESHCDSGDA